MKNKFISLLALGAVLLALASFRGYETKDNSEKIWLELSWPEKKQSYYLEIDTEGVFMMQEFKKKKNLVREGKVKKMFAKDFFREAKNSEILAQTVESESKTLFYKGESIKISAYLDGALKRASAPTKNMSDSFRFAFSELKKEVLKSKTEEKYIAFLKAVPLTGDALETFEKKLPENFEFKTIEVKKLKTQSHIFKAISYPYRLIPLASEDDIVAISDFIKAQGLPGMKSLFYISTTRGNFECSVIESQ